MPEKSPYEGLVPKEKTVTVTSGQNDLNIELVPSGGAFAMPASSGESAARRMPAAEGKKPSE